VSVTTLHHKVSSVQRAGDGSASARCTWPSVARLDAVLNRRLLEARTEAETRHWWRVKVGTKHALADVPDGDLEATADRLARALGVTA
jgi:hypothetical protein